MELSQNLPRLSKKLIPRFIRSKLADYAEPTRKGTPKGEPVGFSKTKYCATLYALRDKVLSGGEDLKAQAKELKVSHGLLRKWRTDPRFKDLVARHEREFFGFLLGSIRHREKRAEVRIVERQIVKYKAVIETLKRLTEVQVARQELKPQLEESAVRTKLAFLMHGNVQEELIRDKANPQALRTYQQLALDHAIRILENRNEAIKHRRALVHLLSGVKETLQ
jgi:hypothetical protein